jgi:hypothetical protein
MSLRLLPQVCSVLTSYAIRDCAQIRVLWHSNGIFYLQAIWLLQSTVFAFRVSYKPFTKKEVPYKWYYFVVRISGRQAKPIASIVKYVVSFISDSK